MIRIASDLHLEFLKDIQITPEKMSKEAYEQALINHFDTLLPILDTDNNTTLILAGDILLFRYINHFDVILNEINTRFQKTIWIPGNHEWYGSTLSKEKLKEYSLNVSDKFQNIYLGNNMHFEENDVHILATTYWSDLNKGDTFTSYSVANIDADYKKIKTVENNRYFKFRPRNCIKEYIEAKAWLHNKIEELKNSDKEIIIVTHHAPDVSLVPEYMKDGLDYHSAYGYTDWDKINKYNNIKLWVHGHIHVNQNIKIKNIPIISNTFGYLPKDLSENYNPTLLIDTKPGIQPTIKKNKIKI